MLWRMTSENISKKSKGNKNKLSQIVYVLESRWCECNELCQKQVCREALMGDHKLFLLVIGL